VHLTLLPYIAAAGEVKTKPTQHSVMKLREIGIQPDMLICRTDRPISQELKDKIAMFCNVDTGNVFTSPDVASIYELPLELHRQGIDERVAEILNIWTRGVRLDQWERIVETVKHPAKGEVRIAIVGKYVELKESYKSLNEALASRRHRERLPRQPEVRRLSRARDQGRRGAARRLRRGARARWVRRARH
jgi:CTP synthase